MAQATFRMGGMPGSHSRLKVDGPKMSPGREAFGKGTKKQNAETVRSELRKTGGKQEGPRKRM